MFTVFSPGLTFGFQLFLLEVWSFFLCSFVYNMSLFFCPLFKICLFIIIFKQFDYAVTWFIFPSAYFIGALLSFWICEVIIFIKFGSILAVIYSKELSCLFPSWTPILFMSGCLKLPNNTDLCSFLSSLCLVSFVSSHLLIFFCSLLSVYFGFRCFTFHPSLRWIF